MEKRRPFAKNAASMQFDSDYEPEYYTLFGKMHHPLLNTDLYVWQRKVQEGEQPSFVLTYMEMVCNLSVVAEFFFFITDNYKITKNKKKINRNNVIFAVDLARVKPQFRKQKISFYFYKFLVNENDIILISGCSQTIYARKMWVKLTNEIDLNAYKIDYRDYLDPEDIRINEKIVLDNYNNKKIWDDDIDTRIMLTKKPV